MSRATGRVLRRVAIAIVALLCVILFLPAQAFLWGMYLALGKTWQVLLNLLGIGLIAFIFAALLSPLEALGWWAGWYGDEVNTELNPGTLVKPLPADMKASRYVIYLDGISQTDFQYLPDAETFLEQLEVMLPDDVLIIKGLMPYSPLNRPLTDDRILSFFWRIADGFQVSRSGGIIGFLVAFTIQLRNLTIVAVSADKRYGQIYNQGTAQVMYNSLINHGYHSQLPITLIGYSGGAQISLGAAPYLKRALGAPIDVISISGVFCGRNNLLQLEHLYHFVGDRDVVERLGAVLFPHRWKLLPLSYWNRAKRYGKITIRSLGQVGHSGAGGPLDHQQQLPDGRTYLQQTLDDVTGIIQDNAPFMATPNEGKESNYERYYRQAAFNRPDYYPLDQTPNPTYYRPIAPWIGRLILPQQKDRRRTGVLFEVHHAEPDYQHLVGQALKLRWSSDTQVQSRVRSVTLDLHFSEDAKYSQRQGSVHPYRLDQWRQVDPLESLAGSRPHDDVIVMLLDPVVTDQLDSDQQAPAYPDSLPILHIAHEPVQITGRFYALVRILYPLEDSDRFCVAHFNSKTRKFDGHQEVVRFPHVVLAETYGVFPSTTREIEKSPANAAGWYIYGAVDRAGLFVVQAIAPRALLRLHPDQVIQGRSQSWSYIKRQSWQVEGQKGELKSVLLTPDRESPEEAIGQWQEGDRALVLHTYGGIGGRNTEPAAKAPIFFGHFAYGVAQVIREPLANELIFDIRYYQVYTHNVDGIIAGTLAWNRFLGDRQVGWLGTRPVCDLLIKLDAVTKEFDFYGIKRSALDVLIVQLEAMTARYRIGDGTGGTYVGPAHNCSQDSNQSLYAAIKQIKHTIDTQAELQNWLTENPEAALRFEQLVQLGNAIRAKLMPFGSARADWKTNQHTLGISPEEDIVGGLLMGLGSWRTLLPRLASETIARQFLQQNAAIWVLRTNQVGGDDPDIEPIAPTPIGL